MTVAYAITWVKDDILRIHREYPTYHKNMTPSSRGIVGSISQSYYNSGGQGSCRPTEAQIEEIRAVYRSIGVTPYYDIDKKEP